MDAVLLLPDRRYEPYLPSDKPQLHLPYEENVALTKKVVDYAHQFDVTVEGELGVLAGVEDEVSSCLLYTSNGAMPELPARLREQLVDNG